MRQRRPYEIASPCPEGVAWIAPLSIWAGIAFVVLYIVTCPTHGGPSLAGLTWPALFISLGWNFLEYGLNPPGDDGPAIGWLVSAGAFFVMGGVPPWWLLRAGPRGLLWGPAGSPAAGPPALAGAAAAPSRLPGTPVGRFRRRSGSALVEGGLLDSLARLAELHESGALTDEEYEAAKRAVLDRGGGPDG